MKYIFKITLKFLIGACVLVIALIMFLHTMQTPNLESGTISDWKTASDDRRMTAVRVLTATDKDIELIVACVNKYATLDDADTVAIQTAVSLCYNGIQSTEEP